MPYYNAAKYIFESVDSIIAQTYKNWELIIIDDCSPAHNTMEVLRNIKALDERIRIMKTPQNSGAGIARNVGIEAAKGRYLAFCDSDDWWYPTKLQEQLQFMIDNNYPFTCTYYEDANEHLDPYYTMKQASRNNFKDLISGCNIGTPGVMIDTQILGKKYMPNLRRAEDWALWLEYLKDTEYLYTYQKVLWKYRHVPGSESSGKFKQLKDVAQMYSEVLNYNILKSWLFCLFIFIPKNLLKKIRKII